MQGNGSGSMRRRRPLRRVYRVQQQRAGICASSENWTLWSRFCSCYRASFTNQSCKCMPLCATNLYVVKGPQVHCVRVSADVLTMLLSGRGFDCFGLALAAFSCPSNDVFTSIHTPLSVLKKRQNQYFFFRKRYSFFVPKFFSLLSALLLAFHRTDIHI